VNTVQRESKEGSESDRSAGLLLDRQLEVCPASGSDHLDLIVENRTPRRCTSSVQRAAGAGMSSLVSCTESLRRRVWAALSGNAASPSTRPTRFGHRIDETCRGEECTHDATGAVIMAVIGGAVRIFPRPPPGR